VPAAAAGSCRAPRAPRSAYLMRMPPRTTLAPMSRAAPQTRATLPSGRLPARWSLIGCSLSAGCGLGARSRWLLGCGSVVAAPNGVPAPHLATGAGTPMFVTPLGYLRLR
jgi:hypothetical protein